MKRSLPPDQDIVRRKSVFGESVQAALNNQRKTAKITVRDKLSLINDELVKFKDSGISYRIICALLEDKLGLHVSQQTLREHCQEELGFRKREIRKATVPKTAKRITQVTKQLTNQVSTKPIKINDDKAESNKFIVIHDNYAASVKKQITDQTDRIFNQIEDY